MGSLLLGALHPGVSAARNPMPDKGLGEELVSVARNGHIPGPGAAGTKDEGESIVKITFSRSGGFAGAAVAIDGSVTFRGDSAQVTSTSGYQRDLASDEIQMLRGAISQLSSPQVASPGPMRDAYQYDVRVSRDDGTTQNLTTYGDPPSGPHGLFGWVRQECDRIWAYRAGGSHN
jgi:hypothetical protein